MAAHDVTFTIPQTPASKADIQFVVRSNGSQLGRLLVSKGALVWYPRKAKKGLKISWTKFDQFAVGEGSKGYHT
jgi:hypothetical protein